MWIDPSGIRSTNIGVRAKTSTINTASGETTLFTITGGRILVKTLIGEVTTVFGATVSNTKLVYDIAAAGPADVDLCATADTANSAVGTLFSITGTVATALQATAGGVVPANANLQYPGLILSAGAVHWNASADPGTGAFHWTMTYVPLDDGATVAAS